MIKLSMYFVMGVNYTKSWSISDWINIKALIQNLQELGFIRNDKEKLDHSRYLLIHVLTGFSDFLY